MWGGGFSGLESMAFVSGGIAIDAAAATGAGSVHRSACCARTLRRCVRCSAADNSSSSASSSSAKREGRKKLSNEELAPPPSTFYQAVTQAQQAVSSALADGHRLLEVEFPPLPQEQLDNSSTGTYTVFDANLRLAIDFSKRFADEGKRVVLVLPDAAEKDRALESTQENEEPYKNVRLGMLKDGYYGTFIDRLFTSNVRRDVSVRDDDDMFVILGASCQELPDVEKLRERAGDRPLVFFNLKLDTARGDLGLPAFPSKKLHFRFLCKVLPVYYLRTRSYSRSVPKPPYVINFNGALFRVFPGDYQVLLDARNGRYERVEVLAERPALGQVRELLTRAMNLGSGEAPAPLLNFLQKGVKSTTWWEDDYDKQESNAWRS